jgi:transketolase
MRGAILDTLFAAMATDERIFFLTADMGINLVERFEQAYTARFLNVGIAEQNLIGVASGLVNAGFRPFAYTISNFLIHRAFEQIRNDIILHQYPVVLLGTSAGWDNAPLGPTHHIIDDWGSLAALGGPMDIYCPCSKNYAASLVPRLLDEARPAYVRIAKSAAMDPAPEDDLIHLPGSGSTLLIAYGTTAATALEARKHDPALGVLLFQKLAPCDSLPLERVISRYQRAVVIEDHFPHSGLYAVLCRLAMNNAWRIALDSAAPQQYSLSVSPTDSGYFRRFGMTAASLFP